MTATKQAPGRIEGVTIMKRDMDLIRSLLLKIEKAPPRASWQAIVTTDDNEPT